MAAAGALQRAARRNSAIFARCWRGLEPAAHQYDMAARVDAPAPYQADFWPRDHGKSEIFCISYPLRRICEDPNVRVLIVQKTATEAVKTLGVIKAELESNQALKAFYRPHWECTVGQADICNQAGAQMVGGKKEGSWQQQRIYVKRRRRGKDPTVEAVGVGGAITGGHFDVIILDDVEDDENTGTDDRIAAMIEWFTGTIMQLREPHTKIMIVGTLKTNRRDIYQIVRENPVWDVFVTGAILSHALDEIQYDLVRNANGIVVDVDVRTPDVRTLWPQKWSIRALLLEMVASLDRAVWIREKLNDLRALAGKIFDRGLFRYFDVEMLAVVEASGGWERLIQIWDTAYEEKKAADWSVCGTLGLFRGLVYLLDVFRAKMELPQLQTAIVQQFMAWRPTEVCVEDAASGKSVLQVLEQQTGLPLVRISPEGRDKVARARSATPYLQAGRILLRGGASWAPTFLDEVAMFPDGAHDDQVDMLVYGTLRLMLGSGSGIHV
jgi:predicted phage terminase large subunit-like protein